MLSNEKQVKRDRQIKAHRRKGVKQHQYPIRLDDTRYSRLKEMSKHSGAMSVIVNKGIDAEWSYYLAVTSLMKEIPNFETAEEVEKWRMTKFKGSPELLAKYATPSAIMTYVKELKHTRETNQLLIDSRETIAYLVRNIATNINQLAHQANAGVIVPQGELERLTKATIELARVLAQERG